MTTFVVASTRSRPPRAAATARTVFARVYLQPIGKLLSWMKSYRKHRHCRGYACTHVTYAFVKIQSVVFKFRVYICAYVVYYCYTISSVTYAPMILTHSASLQHIAGSRRVSIMHICIGIVVVGCAYCVFICS